MIYARKYTKYSRTGKHGTLILKKIDWIWNQDAAEDKARDCSWGR